MSYGMGCAPCTLGLSCIVPGQCVVEVGAAVRVARYVPDVI